MPPFCSSHRRPLCPLPQITRGRDQTTRDSPLPKAFRNYSHLLTLRSFSCPPPPDLCFSHGDPNKSFGLSAFSSLFLCPE